MGDLLLIPPNYLLIITMIIVHQNVPWFICSARAALKTNEVKHNFNVASLSAPIYGGRRVMKMITMIDELIFLDLRL